MRVYYELTLWEEVDDQDADKLKGKMGEMAKRFAGFGCLSFVMRGTPASQPTVPLRQVEEQSPEPQQPNIQEQDEVIDE